MGNRWLWVSALSVVALVAFILFDPGVDDQGKGDALIWERDWRVIEHVPAKAAGATDDREETAGDFNPDDVKGEYRFRLIREPGLYEDRLTVETPRAGRPDAPLVTHVGNLSVRNIFREWNQPKYKAVYDRRTALELDREMTEDNRRLLLYADPDGEPVTVTIGAKLDNGNTVIKTSLEPESIYLVPSIYMGKLDYIFTNYRLKRVLHYPTNAYSREIEITRGEDGAKLLLRQTREKTDEKVDVRWFTGEGLEISLNNASQIDNYVKQIQVDRFDDQAEAVDGRGSLDELWKEAGKDDYVIRVEIEGGTEEVLRLRGIAAAFSERLKSTEWEKKKTGADSFLLLKASGRKKIHLTGGRHGKNLKDKMSQVLSEIATKQREAELKQEAAQNPPPRTEPPSPTEP